MKTNSFRVIVERVSKKNIEVLKLGSINVVSTLIQSARISRFKQALHLDLCFPQFKIELSSISPKCLVH